MERQTREATSRPDPGLVNPAMVALARESRGLTQQEAAQALGISQARLSKIEAGLARVTDEILAGMSDVLGYPERFFTLRDPVLGPGVSEFFHRKQRALPARTLRKLHAEISIRTMNIMRLLRSVEINHGEIPHLDLDDWGSPTEIARALRAQWQIPAGPIQSLIWTIEDSGGIVISWDFGTPRIDALSRYVPGMPRLFFLNDRTPPDRQRLTLAHELGHVVMHESPDPRMEDQAFEFGAEFLMPARDIGTQFGRVDIEKLAFMKPYWGVSMAALLRRATDLGKVTPRMSRHYWAQLSKRGYRLREPDLGLEKEEPRLLQEVLDVHTHDLGFGLKDLSELIVLNEEETRDKYRVAPTRSEMKSQLRAV